jgi:hypothetical protein
VHIIESKAQPSPPEPTGPWGRRKGPLSVASRRELVEMTIELPLAEEIVMFGDSLHGSVRVVRGETGRTMMVSEQPRGVGGMSMEVVSFADPQERPVSILRDAGLHLPNLELFGPASVADLDRVVFAVCIPGSLAARLAPTSG